MAETIVKDSLEPIKMNSSPQVVEGISSNNLTAQFNAYQAKFASLSNAEEFELLKSNLVEIDLGTSLNYLSQDGYLEVTVPIVGMLDLLGGDEVWDSLAQPFASVMAINGYGAKLDINTENYYPRPDYILAEDIIGNQYEIMVGPQGQIELPEDGLGLFSIISSLTFMYSSEQVLQGFGLTNIESSGAKANAVYLLLPPNKSESFEPVIRVTHLDQLNQRQVDVEYKVPLIMQQPKVDDSEMVKLSLQNVNKTETSALLQINIETDSRLLNKKYPFELKVAFDDSNTNFEFSTAKSGINQSQGWQQNSTSSQEFVKSYGLSEYGLTALSRNLFSEFDFTKSLLSGIDYGISNHNGYNDFLISSEAVGLVYDKILSAVINKEIPGDFILAHVPDERILELDLSYAHLDSHDMNIIEGLSKSLSNGDLSELESLYLTQINNEEPTLIQQSLYVSATSDSEIPDDYNINISVEEVSSKYQVSTAGEEVESESSLVNLIESSMVLDSIPLSAQTISDASDIQAGEVGSYFALESNHLATTIHYGDILDFGEMGDVIEGFDITQDKLNLSQLLDSVDGLTPDKINTEAVGESIKVSYTDSSGVEQPLATLIGANVNNDLGNDLSSFIVLDT